MDWKKVGKRLLFPPIWVQLFLIALSAAGLIVVFTKGLEESVVAYICYVVAFYTLTVVCVYCAMVLPKQYRQIRSALLQNPLTHRYLTDRVFRGKVSLVVSLSVNLLYAALNILSWHLYRSWWFVCLALYYSILAVMRFLLVRYVRSHPIGKKRRGELRRAILCSGILLTLNFFLSGAVLMIVYQDKGYEYHGILIYVMALYTFYGTIHAIVDMVKYRKLGSPVMSTAKIISMAAALVSMLNLETAMFSAFGANMADKDQRLMIILTGAGVAFTVIAMASYMIAKCTRQLQTISSAEMRKKHGK